MKKFIPFFVLVLTIAGNSFAQQVKLNKDTSGFSKSPLYIFKVYDDDKEFTALPLLWLIDEKDIASMQIFKDKMAHDQYGEKGKNGVILITLKEGVQVQSLDRLLDQYHIKPALRQLPLYVNNSLTRSTTDMFYSTDSRIKAVTVAKDKETGMKYISIITADYNPNPAPDNQFRIRGTEASGM